jgi:sugar O-acyltransferase (sialic acid O-acetyltransferase NeuD family)
VSLTDVFIVGAGAHGRVVLDILRDAGRYPRMAFAEDNSAMWGQAINGCPVTSFADALARPLQSVGFVVSIGRPSVRLAVCDRIRKAGHLLVNAIHPAAVIEPSAVLGTGCMVGAQAVINSNARLGDAVLVNTGVIVEHDCVIEDGVSLSPGACLAGRVTIGRGVFLCIGVLAAPRIRIGAGSIIGAGALVTEDIPESTLAMGIPCRPYKVIDENFDWGRVL